MSVTRGVPFAIMLALALISGPARAQSPLLREIEDSFVRLHEQVGPCVVNIESKGVSEAGDERMEDLFHFFGIPAPEDGPQSPRPRQRSTGTGFIIDAKGLILTNNHVVESSESITVRLWNGKEYPAEVVGFDSETDVAIVSIEPTEELRAVELGDSDTLQVGQFAIAIGSPRGFEGSVSFGHISALGRENLNGLSMQGLKFQNLIQTDAAINLGNSGGPLCDITGKVIGINTAIVWGANSIGFAIPVNTAKGIIPQLISTGRVTRGFLGVGIQDAKEFADAVGLPDHLGAFVNRVQEDSPAERADIRTYDVVRSVDGAAVNDASDLVRKISAFSPGTKVQLEVWRNGETITLDVDLMERPRPEEVARVEEKSVLGLRVRALTPEIIEGMRLDPETRGVVVAEVEPGSPAEDARLIPGDIIIEVAQREVNSPDEFEKLIEEEGKPGKSILIRFLRGDREPDITVLRVVE